METKTLPGFPGYMVNERGDIIRPTGSVFKNNPNRKRYATVWIEGKTYNAHVLVCSAWHGEKRFNDFVVWHSDGRKGNNNPKNIMWVDRKTAESWGRYSGYSKRKRGDKHHSTIMSNAKKKEALYMLEHGQTVKCVAKWFGVSVASIYKIKHKSKDPF
jgi:hypothetical protein